MQEIKKDKRTIKRNETKNNEKGKMKHASV